MKPNIMKLLLTSLVLLLTCNGALAQQAFSTLEERMTGKEFTTTGLSKLSPQELAALNDWLRAHSVATLDEAQAVSGQGGGSTGTDTRGFENKVFSDLASDDIVARIKGPFSGWRDGTVFELDNGMIWEQAESSTFYMPEAENVQVIIEAGAFGVWRLRAEGYNKAVKVKRIQ